MASLVLGSTSVSSGISERNSGDDCLGMHVLIYFAENVCEQLALCDGRKAHPRAAIATIRRAKKIF